MNAALLALLCLAASPKEATVRAGETLEAVALRTLGDEKAASELRALNGLGDGAPRAGARLKLPGRERGRAANALDAARTALTRVDGGPAGPAAKKLEEAAALFSRARYAEAAALADAAWKEVSGQLREGAAFTVEVREDGETTVISHSGQPVRVEAQGVTRQVPPGATVKVAKGKPPPAPNVAPAPPALSRPRDGATLKLKPSRQKGAFGPLRLAWKAVPGARAYQVEILPDVKGQAPKVFTRQTTHLSVPGLPEGSYWWTVKALGEDGVASAASAARRFEVVEDKLKLEVRGTTWK